MEELFVLELQEVLQRAEYELLHSQALRRAEREASMRLSPSASSTPFATLGPISAHDGYSTVSNDREDDDPREKKGKNKRRLSGPAWMTASPRLEVILSHPPGHVVDGDVPHRSHSHFHITGDGQWGHSYQYHTASSSHNHHHQRLRPEEPPSPISSDSKSLPIATTSPATRTHSYPICIHHSPSIIPLRLVPSWDHSGP